MGPAEGRAPSPEGILIRMDPGGAVVDRLYNEVERDTKNRNDWDMCRVVIEARYTQYFPRVQTSDAFVKFEYHEEQ